MKQTNEIAIGLKGCMSIGTDIYPIEVIEILAKNKIIVRHMTAIVNDDYLIQKDITFTSNPDGRTMTLIKTKSERYPWKVVGTSSYRIALTGTPRSYRDPSF